MDPVIQRSFAGGELSPALAARADQAKYVTGLRTCKNFFVRREGGISNRSGFGYVATVKETTKTCGLMRYVADAEGESVLIEVGVGYFRFHQDGAPVKVSSVAAWSSATSYKVGDIASKSSVNYYCIKDNLNQTPPNATYWYAMPSDNLLEIPHPFGNDGTLPDWSQSGNTITLTSGNKAPHELVYSSLTRWVLNEITTGATVDPPANLAGTAAGTDGTLTRSYVVTAAAADTYEESGPSTAVDVENTDAPTVAAPIALSWDAVTGSPEYYVYCDPYGNGTYGYIGTATGTTSFNDAGQTPDFTVTPPIGRSLFGTANHFPKHSAVWQQRRFFANTNTDPDAIWGSRVGFGSNFNISSPLQDDDAINFRTAGNNHHPVRALVPLKVGLVLMTGGGEWTLAGPITPASINPEQETYFGIAEVRPCVNGNTIVYVQSRGTIVRSLSYDYNVAGLAGADLTIFATHLFNGHTIKELDYQQVPHSIVWCVRSDGVLLGLTYIPEQQVWGWHQHDSYTKGGRSRFEHVCVVPEDQEDALYAIVNRTLDGATVRTIERLEPRTITDFAKDSFFVDSGLSYSGTPANAFSGLDHLKGEVVAVVGDGTVVFNGDPDDDNAADFTVDDDGEIVLTDTYSEVHIGLPIRFAEAETLDLDVSGSNVRGKKKLVGAVTLLVDESERAFWAGPDRDHLTEYVPQAFDGTDPFTGAARLAVTANFNDYGRVVIRQVDPLPLTILGVMPEVEVGG